MRQQDVEEAKRLTDRLSHVEGQLRNINLAIANPQLYVALRVPENETRMMSRMYDDGYDTLASIEIKPKCPQREELRRIMTLLFNEERDSIMNRLKEIGVEV